jgi:hypothetical protein
MVPRHGARLPVEYLVMASQQHLSDWRGEPQQPALREIGQVELTPHPLLQVQDLARQMTRRGYAIGPSSKLYVQTFKVQRDVLSPKVQG